MLVSLQACNTTSSQGMLLFMRMHLWKVQELKVRCLLSLQEKVTHWPLCKCLNSDDYLNAWPLLGQSGYQWSLYFSHRSLWRFSANNSALAPSKLPRVTAIRLRKSTPALISCFIVTVEKERRKKTTQFIHVILCMCFAMTSVRCGRPWTSVITLPCAVFPEVYIYFSLPSGECWAWVRCPEWILHILPCSVPTKR